MGKRNPHATSLRTNPAFRSQRAKSTLERAEQRDEWHRGAKYKVDPNNIEESIQIGDSAEYRRRKKDKPKEVMVKTPNGPADLIGITIDGEYKLVPEETLTIISEALARMRELSK